MARTSCKNKLQSYFYWQYFMYFCLSMASCAAHLKRYGIQLIGTPTTINNTDRQREEKEKKNLVSVNKV